MVMYGNAGDTVVAKLVFDHYISCCGSPRSRRKDTNACAGARDLGTVVPGTVARDCVLNYAEGHRRGRDDDGCGCVRRHRDAAVEGIIVNIVSLDQVVLARACFVADQDATGVKVDLIPKNRGMIHGYEVYSFTAVIAFVSFESRNYRACPCCDLERSIVARHVIVHQRNVSCVHCQDSFEVGALEH